MSEILLISASNPQSLDGQTPDNIVYMPRGEWKISPTVDGKAGSVEVLVDSDAATILQESLTERLKDTIRPHAAFDHKTGPASFLPKQFKWDEDRGVVLEVDWTKSGKEAVSGRDYSYFSPTFLLKDKKVVGLPKDGEIGSLTNNPAFRKIQRIAASADKIGETSMVKVKGKLVELQLITAQQAESDDEDLLVQAINGLHGALVTAQKAADLLKAENTDLQTKVHAAQETEATKVIEAAIAEGKIPPKDAETIKYFKEEYIRHPETIQKVLKSLTGNSAIFKKEVDVTGREKYLGGGQTAAEIIHAQHVAVAEIQETNPGMTFDTAFNKAREKRPELFIEA